MAFVVVDRPFIAYAVTAFFIKAFFLELSMQNRPMASQGLDFDFEEFQKIGANFFAPIFLENRDSADPIGFGIDFEEAAGRNRLFVVIENEAPARSIVPSEFIVISLLFDKDFLPNHTGIFGKAQGETRFHHGNKFTAFFLREDDNALI